ncbi:MAG: hypothetical protein V4644_01750 [Patescibacteria group bacterium]
MEKYNELRTVWSLLCGSSSIDHESNNISLYKIVEQLNLTKKPDAIIEDGAVSPAHLSYEFITLLQRSGSTDKKATYPTSMRIVDPTGKVMQELPVPAVFEEGMKRLRMRIDNDAVPITVAGEYQYQIVLDDIAEPLASTPLEVIIK